MKRVCQLLYDINDMMWAGGCDNLTYSRGVCFLAQPLT